MRTMLPELAPLEPPRPQIEDLLGTWSIVRTNFPMWLGKRKLEPRFEYGAIASHPDRMRDCVRYRQGGRDKTILGVDRQDPALPCHFTWRGRGLLALLRSEWFVIDLDQPRDAEVGTAAILFSKTLFTPAGLDIVTRSPTPDAAVVDACLARLDRAPALAEQLASLVEIHHGPVIAD